MKVKLEEVVEVIFFRLKTGYQRCVLPMKQFFRIKYKWQSVFYHFQKWSKDVSWEEVWGTVSTKYKHLLDMSSIQLDGTHTPVKRGGEAVAHQGRKIAMLKYFLFFIIFQYAAVTLVSAQNELKIIEHNEQIRTYSCKTFYVDRLRFRGGVLKIKVKDKYVNVDIDSSKFLVFKSDTFALTKHKRLVKLIDGDINEIATFQDKKLLFIPYIGLLIGWKTNFIAYERNLLGKYSKSTLRKLIPLMDEDAESEGRI